MIIQDIKKILKPGTIIPKPISHKDYIFVRYGKSRGEEAIVYRIPKKNLQTKKNSEKRIPLSIFEVADDILNKKGILTREWFAKTYPKIEADGSCNFTTLGGIFELLGKARHDRPGVYIKL